MANRNTVAGNHIIPDANIHPDEDMRKDGTIISDKVTQGRENSASCNSASGRANMAAATDANNSSPDAFIWIAYVLIPI